MAARSGFGHHTTFWVDLEMTYQLKLLENKDMPEVVAL